MLTDKEREFVSSLKALMIRYGIEIVNPHEMFFDGEPKPPYFTDHDEVSLRLNDIGDLLLMKG